MSLYVYVRPCDDNNHAPHFSRGLMSLANCVWQVRDRANVGDWLLGLTSVKKYPDGLRRVSYIARIDEKITREKYWERYAHYNFYRRAAGRFDNFYEPSTCWPRFKMRPNPIRSRWNQACTKDMKSPWVLLSRTFRDFGPNTDFKFKQLYNPYGLHMDPFWWEVHYSLQPPRQRHYRRFPWTVLSLDTLELGWELNRIGE